MFSVSELYLRSGCFFLVFPELYSGFSGARHFFLCLALFQNKTKKQKHKIPNNLLVLPLKNSGVSLEPKLACGYKLYYFSHAVYIQSYHIFKVIRERGVRVLVHNLSYVLSSLYYH